MNTYRKFNPKSTDEHHSYTASVIQLYNLKQLLPVSYQENIFTKISTNCQGPNTVTLGHVDGMSTKFDLQLLFRRQKASMYYKTTIRYSG
jgi:hypothetical protein